MPVVSVIIPVYGVEPYMARCARSLFGQTLLDMEYIFVDDCTPDKSIEIMRRVLEEEYPARLPQVKVFRMPRNSGQAKVRMEGLALATGNYVIHCDSDDRVEPDAYERMYNAAIAGDFDLVTADFYMGDDGAWKLCRTGSENGREMTDILSGRVMGNVWCRLVRRELLKKLVPPASNMAEDMVLCLQFTAKAVRIGHVEEPLYYYYVRPSSISHGAGMAAALARQESLYTNARLAVKILESQYGYGERDASIVFFKYKARHYLNPYVQHREVYIKWCDTFPEINNYFYKTSGIPLKEKFWFLLIHFHLYHPWKTVTKAIRKGFNGLLK